MSGRKRAARGYKGDGDPGLEGPVTVREFYETMRQVDRRFSRIEKVLMALAFGVLAPKVSSAPEPSQVIGWLLGAS